MILSEGKEGETDPVLGCPSRSLMYRNFVRTGKKENWKKAVLGLILFFRDFLLEENAKLKLESCHILVISRCNLQFIFLRKKSRGTKKTEFQVDLSKLIEFQAVS